MSAWRNKHYVNFRTQHPELAQKILVKYNWSCVLCDSHKDLVIHHKEKAISGEPLFTQESNLTLYCRSCHTAHHRQVNDISTKGYGRRGSLEIIYCSIEGCDRVQHAQKLCKKHYTQRNRHKWLHG